MWVGGGGQGTEALSLRCYLTCRGLTSKYLAVAASRHRIKYNVTQSSGFVRGTTLIEEQQR